MDLSSFTLGRSCCFGMEQQLSAQSHALFGSIQGANDSEQFFAAMSKTDMMLSAVPMPS